MLKVQRRGKGPAGGLWLRKMSSLTNKLRKGEKTRDCSGAPLRRGRKKLAR